MNSLERTARWVGPQEYGTALYDRVQMAPSLSNPMYTEETASKYANIGKVPLNPTRFWESAQEAGQGATQIGEGVGAGVGISVGRFFGEIVGEEHAGAMAGATVGRGLGGVLGTVLNPVGTVLGGIMSLPAIGGNPMAAMQYLEENDPQAAARLRDNMRRNPLAILSMVSDSAKEAERVRYEKRMEREAAGEQEWALARDLDFTPSTVGEQIGQLMGGLMLVGNMTQRAIIGATSRAEDFKKTPREHVSPELIPVWERAQQGRISDEALLDELVMAGQPLGTAEGNIANALANLGFSIIADPLLLLDFGTGILARSGASAARAGGTAFFRGLAERHGTEMADQITGNLWNTLSRTMSPKKLDRMIKSDTVTNELFLAAVKQGIDPDLAADAIASLPKRQQLAMQLDQGQRMTGVYQVVKAVNFNFAEIGLRNNAPVMNAHLSSEATRGGAAAFGIDNYVGMQDFFTSHGVGEEFNRAFGIFIGNMGRGTAAEMLADDVMRTNLVPMAGAEAVRPTQVIEDRLATGMGQSFGHWVEAYIRRRKKDFMPVGKQTREQVIAVARETAIQQMKAITDSKIADDALRTFIAGLDEDGLSMIHAMHYGRRVSQVKEAIRKAARLPSIIANPERMALVERVTYIGPEELTRQRAERLLQAIADSDIDEVKRSVRAYDDLARQFSVEGFDDRTLMRGVEKWLNDHLDDLTVELSQNQLDELPGPIRRVQRTMAPTNATLGLRPEAVGRAEWRMKYENGRLVSTKPWLDASDDVAEAYNPGTLGALRDKMGRSISTERIFYEAKKSFVSRLVEDENRKFTYQMTQKTAEDLFGSVMRTASEMGTTPRGLGMTEIRIAAEKVEGIGLAMARGEITPRDLQDAILLGFEGSTMTVGATQKFTGTLKAKVGVKSGHNAIGEIAESLYPKLKFGRWAFFFQAQEALEPYAFATMRGIRIGVRADELDMQAQELMNRYMAQNEFAKFDFMERSMAYLWGNQAAYTQAGGAANEVWAEGLRGKFQTAHRGLSPARAKVQAQRRMYREFLGTDMKRRFDAINPMLWPRLQVRYNSNDAGEIAMRWLREADVWSQGAGEVAMSPLMAEAARPQMFGNTAAVDYDRVAKRLITPTSTIDDLVADVQTGKVTFADMERELLAIGATPEYVQKAWIGANLDVDAWWDAWADFGYSRDAIRHERRLAQVRAEAMGISEREFMAHRVRGVGPVSIGAEDFIGLTPTEWDNIGVMFQMASDPTLARMYSYGGRIGAEAAQETTATLAEIEGRWLDRANLRDPVTGKPKGRDQERIIQRMGEEATAMAPLEKVNLGGRTAYIPGGEAALRDPNREWTVWEAQVIRSQMINPKDVTISDLSVGLYRRMWKAHEIDLTSMDTVHQFFNNIGFAMFSPNMNLTRNEMINTRFRTRGFGDADRELEQSADTILGLSDRHDNIVSKIAPTKKEGVDVTANEIGFARGAEKEVGNYVPVGAVAEHVNSGGPRVSTSANAMSRSAEIGKDYLRSGYRKKHNLKASPMLQWLSDMIDDGLAKGDQANWDDLVPEWAKAKTGDPAWQIAVPVKPKGPKRTAGALTRYEAAKQQFPLHDPKGKAKVPADPKARGESIAKTVNEMVAAGIDDETIGHWVAEATYVGESARYVSAKGLAGRAVTSNADMSALIMQARDEIQQSASRLDELTEMLEAEGDEMSEALQDELEALSASGASGHAVDALYEIFPGAKEQDGMIAVKPWRHNAWGVEDLDDALTSEGRPYAYIKNPDVVWRNMATNRAMGSMMQLARAVAEDPDFYRIRPHETPSMFAERILNTTNGLAMKTGYFSVDLSGVEKFDRGVMDRQMVGTLSNWLWEKTGGPGNPEWDAFYNGLTKSSRDKIDGWIAKGRPADAGDYGWSDAPAMKIGVLKTDKATIADLKKQGPQATRTWITNKIEKAVAAQEKKTAETGVYSGGMTRADAERFFATFTEDADLEKVLGRDITIYGSDYRAYDDLLTQHKNAALAADPAKNGWLGEVGNGAYQWYLWDEYRNIWDPELTVLRQAHQFQPVDLRQLAISDKVHGKSGYLKQGGLPTVGTAGYQMIDPQYTLMQQAGEGRVRGATMFFSGDNRALVGLSELKDGTTFQHEIAHALYQNDLNPSQMQVIVDDFNAKVGDRTIKIAEQRVATATEHAAAIKSRTGHEVTRNAAEAEAKVARKAEVDAQRAVGVAERAVQTAKDAKIRADATAAEALKRRNLALRAAKMEPGETLVLREREAVAQAKVWLKDPKSVKPGAEIRLDTGTMISDADIRVVSENLRPLVEHRADGTYWLKVPKKYTVPSDVAGRTRTAINQERTARFAASDAIKAVENAENELTAKQAASAAATAAHAPKRAAADAAQAVWEEAVKVEAKTRDAMTRAAAATVGATKTAWDHEVAEHFVDEFLKWKATGKAPNPKLHDAFAYFRRWLLRVWDVLKKNPDAKVSPEVTEVFESLFRMPDPPQHGFAYDAMEEGLHQAGVTSSRVAEDAAHTNVFFRRRRNFVERSMNHPYFGYYPSSYMWGKVLPEMIRFLAAEPFGIPAPGGGFLLSQRIWNSVEMQKDSDPEFRQYLADHEGAIRGIGMMLPATPFEVPVNDPLWLRRFAKWGIEASDALQEGYDISDIKDFDPGKVAEDVITYAAGPIQGVNYMREMVGGAQNVVNDAIGGPDEGNTSEMDTSGLLTSFGP